MFGFNFQKNTNKIANDEFSVDNRPSAINTSLKDIEFIELELLRWKKSAKRKEMLEGERYFQGEHDILKRKRTVIGKDGKVEEVNNLPNNKTVDNQYAKMVELKVDYILGRPLKIKCKDELYVEALNYIFDKRFYRTLKSMAENCLNCGIAWLYPYYNDKGDLRFMRFEPFEVLPFWKDADHTVLDKAVRLYQIEVYEGTTCVIKEKVEIYYSDRIEKYDFTDGKLTPDKDNPVSDYITRTTEKGVETYNWGKVPLIPFKYNNREIPLIRKVKGLQDSINTMLSDFQNNMQEDSRNTILIIKNYDGQNLAEFRHNLAAYGAVKVKTIDGSEGGVDALRIEVNSANYRLILELLKEAIIENAMGYDPKDDRLKNDPNQMNIQSIYSDVDLDSNNIETEFKASFEELLEFVNIHFINKGLRDFSNEPVDIVFNRNVMMNNTELIDNCVKCVGILSEETLLTQHPWIDDAKDEMARKKAEFKASEEYQLLLNGEINDEKDD